MTMNRFPTTSAINNLPGGSTASSPVRVQKVVIVNGSPEALELLETVDAGHYDVVFVEPNEHAYSRVKRVRPHLVILCVRFDDIESFQVLSMLKLDAETRSIPLITYAFEMDGRERREESTETSENPLTFRPKTELWMN
jgi:PleD family two-component response regulator